MSCLYRPVATFLAVCAFASLSQASPRPAWRCTTTTKVKPEKRQEFEGYLKQLMAAHRKGGTPWFLTLQTVAGETAEYTTLVPVMRFADLDRPPVPVAVLGQAAWERLSRRAERCYSAQTREYSTPLSALEIDGDEAALDSYWVEARSQVAPDRMDDYLGWLKQDYRPALEKVGVTGFRVAIAVFGSSGGEVVSMRMLRSLAEIDEGSILSRALGDDGARAVIARATGMVGTTSTRILRARVDLSYD
jgi:hypothetical protein